MGTLYYYDNIFKYIFLTIFFQLDLTINITNQIFFLLAKKNITSVHGRSRNELMLQKLEFKFQEI